MKITLICLIFSILICISFCARVTQEFDQSRNYGVFTPRIQAEDIGDLPASYFLCKIAFRETQWVKTLWNCNCGQRWYRGRKR